MKVDILTLFPGMFKGYFDESIMKRAREKGILELKIHNLRDWTDDPHRSVDDKPCGGGAGMVMMVPVIDRAVEDLKREKSHVVLLSPQGELLDQEMARMLALKDHLILICGHYEGVDERVAGLVIDQEISIGDYIITNGSLAAMIVVDAVGRLLPGVVGDQRSVEEDSFSKGLLDYPHYTRPRVYKGLEVPPVLLSGNHEGIRKWRRREALRKTLERRAELLKKVSLNREDRDLLKELEGET